MFSKKNICIIFAILICSLLFVGCKNKEEVKTVEWYSSPENKAALDTKLKECNNNPGELNQTPNCQNAHRASVLRWSSGTMTPYPSN